MIYSRSELGKIEQYLEKMLKDIQSKRSKKSKQNQLRAFKMAKETAMRGGEIWSLLLSNIRIAERKILLRVNTELDWNPKSKEEEWVPISKFLAAFLEEDLKTRAPEEQWFLDNGRGQNYYSSEEKLARPFTLMNRKLGILGPKPIHGIRASVITHLLEDGHPPQKVQKLARHKLLSTTMGYFNTENLAVHDLVDTISIAHESPTALGVSYKE
ncbi:MAG: site-specific integrase [Deltaproteobacteria bacterium]|nr:site-specific integrase [Deltaproteobacteria bacterium]